MKELSKEDKRRIDREGAKNGYNVSRASFINGAEYEHPIAFEKGKIEGFNEHLEIYNEMLRDRDSWKRAALKLKDDNDSKFNEGIEAAKALLISKGYNFNGSTLIDEIEKLKKVSNEKGTV